MIKNGLRYLKPFSTDKLSCLLNQEATCPIWFNDIIQNRFSGYGISDHPGPDLHPAYLVHAPSTK